MPDASHTGGAFADRALPVECIRTPEEFSDEQKQIRAMTQEFVENEILPVSDRIEKVEPGLMRSLVEKAGDLGLLGVEIAEPYGGMGLGTTTAAIVAEAVGPQASYSISQSVQTGIGSLPIVYFGTAAQKEKYLPLLATGKKFACYALTEPSSGTDALAAKCKATLNPDGKTYTLNGTKMWITNAGFSDVYVVFAKIDGEKFSAFIIDRDTPGFSVAPEEKKLGLKGSSTCALNLKNAQVPADHVLGEIGKGHKIAFNILNVGRFKLGSSAVGAAKYALRCALGYAHERHQFGKPIATFGAIQHKLAQMAVNCYVGESMIFATAGLIDRAAALPHAGVPDEEARLAAIEEHAVECSIMKVGATEILDYVADEAVQIYGGYGYSAEYPVERIYRDSRINRIFEGTNEINRIIIPTRLIRAAGKGELPHLAEALKNPWAGVEQIERASSAEGRGAQAGRALAGGRAIVQLVCGLGQAKFGKEFADQQEILCGVADLCIALYGADVAFVRSTKAWKNADPNAEIMGLLAKVALQEAMQKFRTGLEELLPALVSPEQLPSAIE
ncbi:MAG TPA: acyl-CoA dehydrogenase family protein, partial [Planctomycetota bacterium]|nr:acyl-CoA dehydrogenase family protein [Planctomycetota bacterium]